MAFDRFFIAPLENGLVLARDPWIIPDNAFERLQNAYVYRGRVRKRFGLLVMDFTQPVAEQQLFTRLRIGIPGGAGVGITDGAGNATGVVPGAVFANGQMFSIGTEIFTVYQNGNMYTTGASTTATYNTATGAFNFVGATPATQVFFYPATPVMGIFNYERDNINDETLIAFDTQFSYVYTAGSGWDRIGAAVWTGSDSDFFWAYNYRGNTQDIRLLFVSNYVVGDQIKYLNGTAWTTINPTVNATGPVTLESARIIVPFKNRLLALNVIQSNGTFVNRCRFSQNGSPLDADAWQEEIVGKGGFIDAPINEAIVSAEFLKDRLIVFFERSTFELVYVENEVLPFVWQEIDTSLGAKSTFSKVAFDRAVLVVGTAGIHACTGTEIQRIDDKIPDEVVDIQNANNGADRVYGVRDFNNEFIYWTFPVRGTTSFVPTYQNKILVYNYETSSWALFDDVITVFGYLNRDVETILAGNPEGFVLQVDTDADLNSVAFQITDIAEAAGMVSITCIDHNLSTGDFVRIENVQGFNGINGNIYQIAEVDSNTFILTQAGTSGAYIGGGGIARVSRIDILTKQFNPYIQSAKNVYISHTDFLVDRTTNGSITVDYWPSYSTTSMITAGTASGAIVGNNILETSAYGSISFEADQTKVWHRIYFQAEGEAVQFRIYMTDTQMVATNIQSEDFVLHAMCLFSQGINRLQ